MATAVQITNQALDALGTAPINDFDEQSAAAQITSRNWEPTRKELLSSYPWSFATKTTELVGTALTTDPRWAYSFQLPADYLKVISLVDVDEATVPWQRRGSSIFINSSCLVIEYIWDEADTTQYPPLFNSALSFLLASKIAYAITKKQDVVASMIQGYLASASIARGSDGTEQKLENTIGTSFVTVRS